MLRIYVDADGCPVKEEVFRVARRYDLPVLIVSNKPLRVPDPPGIENVVVGGGFDEADDWIAGRIAEGDIVITTDIPLAARCLAKGARALSPKGTEFTEAGIGGALAGRALNDHLRQMGIPAGGPSPMSKRDRSAFLSKLDQTIQTVRRRRDT